MRKGSITRRAPVRASARVSRKSLQVTCRPCTHPPPGEPRLSCCLSKSNAPPRGNPLPPTGMRPPPRRNTIYPNRKEGTIRGGSATLHPGGVGGRGLAGAGGETAQAAPGPVAQTAQTPGVTVPPDDPAIDARTVTFPAGSVQVQGYLALPRGGGRVPGVLVIHENRGLLESCHGVEEAVPIANIAAGIEVGNIGAGRTARFSDL